MTQAAFKYTFPIQKAEKRDDGLYIVGFASGPELDAEGERIDEVMIYRFAEQINSTSGMPLADRLPYRDAHAKDGVFMDLGWITRAWVNEQGHLGVEVKLDDESPAATHLFRQIQRGKQFGMSVGGMVIDFVDEYVESLGRFVRTYTDIILREISNTTRPAWSPSFGTVLAKAIKDAEESESTPEGDNPSMDEELQQDIETPATDSSEQPEVEKADEAEAVTEEEAVEKTDEVEETEEVEKTEEEPAAEEAVEDAEVEKTDEPAEEAEPEVEKSEEESEEAAPEAEVEKAEEPDASTDELAKAMADSITNYIQHILRGVASGDIQKTVSADEESTLTKSLQAFDQTVKGLESKVEDLSKSLHEATARIEELENSPAGDDAPDMIERAELTFNDVQKALETMPVSDRLRLGLRAAFENR